MLAAITRKKHWDMLNDNLIKEEKGPNCSFLMMLVQYVCMTFFFQEYVTISKVVFSYH